jgi:hypothetical protein
MITVQERFQKDAIPVTPTKERGEINKESMDEVAINDQCNHIRMRKDPSSKVSFQHLLGQRPTIFWLFEGTPVQTRFVAMILLTCEKKDPICYSFLTNIDVMTSLVEVLVLVDNATATNNHVCKKIGLLVIRDHSSIVRNILLEVNF